MDDDDAMQAFNYWKCMRMGVKMEKLVVGSLLQAGQPTSTYLHTRWLRYVSCCPFPQTGEFTLPNKGGNKSI